MNKPHISPITQYKPHITISSLMILPPRPPFSKKVISFNASLAATTRWRAALQLVACERRTEGLRLNVITGSAAMDWVTSL